MMTDSRTWNSFRVLIAFVGLVAIVAAFLPTVAATSDPVPSAEACAANLTSYLNTLSNTNTASPYPNATEMLLATGKTGGDLGDYFLCQALPEARACTIQLEIPNLCSFANESDPSSILTPQCTIGVCLPNFCNGTILNADNGGLLLALQVMGVLPTSVTGLQFNCDGGHPPPLSLGAKVTFGIVGLFVLLCIIGTVVDLYCNEEGSWLYPWKRQKDATMYDQLENEENYKSGTKYLDSNRSKHRYIRAFSLTANLTRLLTPIPGGLEAFNGLRVFSIMWVILGHTYGQIATNALNNIFLFTIVINRWFFQFVPNGEYAVDTFFFISGFLVTYFLYKRLLDKGLKNFFPMEFLMYYVHRILRIMPLYMFVLLIYTQLTPWMGDGPLWFATRAKLDASYQYCWANVVFVNNFIPYDFYDQCMGWSWFLAVDFQFYILTPFFVILYYLNRIAGIVLMTLTFATAIFTQGFLADKYNMSWAFLSQVINIDYFNLLYGKPWTRCSPYLIGMATAIFLVEISIQKKEASSLFDDYPPSRARRRQRIPAWLLAILYALAFAFLGLTVFGTHGAENWSHWQSVGFIAVNRTVFSLGVAILMFIFALDYGGWLRSIFSIKIWDPLAKLTYGAYLVHMIVIQVYFGSQPGFVYYSTGNIIYWFLATTIFSYFGAALCYLLVEKPLMTIETLLLAKDSKA